MANVKERVDQYLAATELPPMTIIPAVVEEKQHGATDVRGDFEKESGVRPAFPPEEEPQEATAEEQPAEEATDGEVDDAVGNIMDRLGFKTVDPTEKPPEEKPVPKPEPEPEPEPDSKEETPPEEKPKPKARRKKAEGLDAEDIKDIIRETAQSVAQPAATAPAEAKAGPDAIETLNQSDLAAFEEMEKDPKYSGIREKYKGYLTKLSQYKADWEKDNPSATFSPEDLEHEEYVASHQPEYNAGDFQDAKVAVKTRGILQEQEHGYRRELEQLRAKVDETDMKEELQGGSNASYAEVVKIADESYLKVVQDGGGEALKEADPVAHEVLNGVLAANEKHLYELEKVTHPSKKFSLDGGNEVHRALIDFALKKEQDIANLPASQQMHEGKRFVTASQWMGLSEVDRKRHWSLQPEHIKAMYISDLGNQAKVQIEKQREVFDKYMNYKSGKKTAPKGNAKTQKTQQRQAKSNPPSTAGEAVSATGGNASASVDLGDDGGLSKRLWG